MQPIRQFMNTVSQLASQKACLFSSADLRSILPEHSEAAFKTLLSRAGKDGQLTRLCRGVYLYEKAISDRGSILHHAISKIRPLGLNYQSLESLLSEAGVISQIPMNRITVMSSGRSGVIDCGKWGTIEFVKTRQPPAKLVGQLTYDPTSRLWRASVSQALRDMRATHRNMDLVDWKVAHEFV